MTDTKKLTFGLRGAAHAMMRAYVDSGAIPPGIYSVMIDCDREDEDGGTVSFMREGDSQYLPMPRMTEARAREILGDWIREDDAIDAQRGDFALWWPDRKSGAVSLEADFTADQLEAIAWWMRNRGAKK